MPQRRNTSGKGQPPAYKDKEFRNRPGEQWKDIPGLEGYFMVSNHGRVRRMEYEMQYRDGRVYVKPEMIISPGVVQTPNRHKKDFQYFLTTRVKLNGQPHNFTLARLVYYCFVQKFNLDDLNLVLSYKDNDHFNLHPRNLILTTIPQQRRKAFEKGRAVSPFKNPSKALRAKQRAATIKRLSNQVTQYSLQGKKLKTFSSMAAAQRATGINATDISNVASSKHITAGSFIWRWGNAPSVDVAAFLKTRQEKLWAKHGQKVTQFDLAGNIIAHYPSLRHAVAATGANEHAIRMVLKGVYRSAKGFFWKKGYSRTTLDLSGHHTGRAAQAKARQKKIKQYTPEGHHIRTFDSMKEAVACTGISKSSISRCCREKKKISKGYIWKYA
ncbi:MAG: hypothetical protein J0H74_30600 [Chitinophagaceae bacterium]|nr:hypothetical protein [Chitinophagaceae bacterium]